MIARADITGVILAGGRGSRMGGVDKGLQLLHGRPMIAHVLARLAPQVDALEELDAEPEVRDAQRERAALLVESRV